MTGFVGRFTNRIDRKGRVSVPASFRQVLSRDGFSGLFLYPSLDMQALDCGGNALIGEIEKRLSLFGTFTEEHDYLSTAFYGLSEQLTMDGEGRIGLTEPLLDAAGITEAVTFVGQGYKFQIWEPGRYQLHEVEARKRALALRHRIATGPGGETP
jgi:MraZ protein